MTERSVEVTHTCSPALREQKQGQLPKVKADLVDVVPSRPARATE